MVNDEFKDKAVLITGGARGIGFATAQMFAAAGARIALADIDGEAAITAAGKLTSATEMAGLEADISKPEQVRAMVAEAVRRLGRIDIFVNSAAILDDKLFLESGPADWERMLSICLWGPMLCLREILPGMVERGWGRVICLASDAGRVGGARLSYYAAAKGGVIALIKSVAQEVGSTGVTLNVVSPGATNTPLRMAREERLRAQIGEEKYARRVKSILKMYPIGRLGEPDDIAAAVVFLAGERASWITGQVLSINGGFVMP
jgi:NAD(P)-dependent dehydrogenase (short-subunit alcohol dehydrogenase family)